MKRKICSVVTIILLVLLTATTVLANNYPINSSKGVSEYLVLKELQNKSEKELLTSGFSQKGIADLKAFDYSEMLKERSKLDYEILKNKGYSDEQIKMLRNFQGTEEEMILLSSYLYLNAEEDDYYYDGEKTYFEVNFDWEWTTEPASLNTDIVGMGWSEDMYLGLSSLETNHTVTYKNSRTGNEYDLDVDVNRGKPAGTAESTFDMMRNVDSMGYYDWGKSGYGNITVFRHGEIQICEMNLKYGNSRYTVTPSVGVGAGGIEVGFSPSYSVEEMDEDWVRSEL